MKVKVIFVFALIFMFAAMCLVVALEVKKSEIIIRTKPYQNLTLKFVDSITDDTLQTYSNRSRKFGELRWAFYSVVGEFKLFITDLDVEDADSVEYGPYQTGVLVDVNFSGWSAESNPSPPVAISNIVEELEDGVVNGTNNSTNSSANQNIGGSVLTGRVIDSESISSGKYYFVAIGAFALAIAIFVVRRLLRNKMTTNAPQNSLKVDKIEKLRPLVDAKRVRNSDVIAKQRTTDDAEKEILDLQKQLNELKNEERVVELQRQVAREKESLRKMRG